jgi:hypothetical protein
MNIVTCEIVWIGEREGEYIKDISMRSYAKGIDYTSSAGIARLVKLKESRMIVFAVSFIMIKKGCD